jgi:hypothetical protein
MADRAVSGHGGFGEVRLERNTEDGEMRAVKRSANLLPDLSSYKGEKELKVPLEFSYPMVSQIWTNIFGISLISDSLEVGVYIESRL